MEVEKAEQLSQLLKRLNQGENTSRVKHEAQSFLETINPADLSFAEQKLIEAGLKPEDLRQLCSIHMEMIGDEVGKLKKSIPAGHVVHTLVSEHDEILHFLDELETVNNSTQKMKQYSKNREEFNRLKHIAEHLIEAESHHKREEDVLFPELEKHGVFGPPQIMRMEHQDLRRRKKELLELSEKVGRMNFDEFKKGLDATSKLIVLMLRDHIFKENNILYPTALQVIDDVRVWERMRSDCDKIGYCCFTPTQALQN